MTRKPRFPFIIGPYERKRSASGDSAPVLDALSQLAEKTSRVLASLSVVESSLDELMEKAGDGQEWREFYRKLLPILDGIDATRRALEGIGDSSWKRGMEILSDKLIALLEAHGLLRGARVGMTFDPSRHESVGARDSTEVAPGAVAEVVENGWLYRGDILRFAKVIVARGSS